MNPRVIAVSNRHPRLRIDRRGVERLLRLLESAAPRFAIRQPAFLHGELSIVFLTDRALARLHGAFLNDPTTTDVITFAGDPQLGAGGEICVSADTAHRFARTHGVDFSRELTLYVVHGWLHLAGYDDLAPARKRVMRRAEARALRLLERQQAIPRFSLRRPRGPARPVTRRDR